MRCMALDILNNGKPFEGKEPKSTKITRKLTKKDVQKPSKRNLRKRKRENNKAVRELKKYQRKTPATLLQDFKIELELSPSNSEMGEMKELNVV